MDTLKKHLPFSGQDGLHELKKIAERFEEKIYSAATSQVLSIASTNTSKASINMVFVVLSVSSHVL